MHERWARLGVVLILAGSVAACAIPFGEDPDRYERNPRERNQLFLEEQERLERQRQTLEPVRPSER
jgi:hypothetical protein